MGNLPIKILGVGLLALLVFWLWPSSESGSQLDSANAAQSVGAASASTDLMAVRPSELSDIASAGGELAGELVSSIQPIPDDQLAIVAPRLSQVQSGDLNQRFASANQSLANGDGNGAATQYQSIIDDYPNFIEPYVNLAAAQANTGQLEQARQTLVKATAANQSTKVLFESINKLHGFLAAQAYRNALESKTRDGSWTTTMVLPKVQSLATDFEQAQRIKELADKLNQQQTQQLALSADDGASKAEMDRLKSELDTASSSIVQVKEQHQKAITALQSDLQIQQQRTSIAENKVTQLQSDVASAESDLVAKLRIELGNAENAVGQAQEKLSELTASNERLNRQLAASQAEKAALVASVAAASQPAASTGSSSTASVSVTPQVKEDKDAAVALVKGWANAWSAQNVDAYVGFYRRGYKPNASVSHPQWLEQRRVRLTNKRFIEVAVRDFSVERTAQGFSVTFTQHYRSNTLDDTIRKSLLFTAPAGSEWSDAKITAERIVR